MDLYEIWKPTQYKNYEVSNKGRVRNKTTKVILKPCKNKQGYLQVGLMDNKKHYVRRVHINRKLDLTLKARCQLEYMKQNNASIEDFIKRYGRNYL